MSSYKYPTRGNWAFLCKYMNKYPCWRWVRIQNPHSTELGCGESINISERCDCIGSTVDSADILSPACKVVCNPSQLACHTKMYPCITLKFPLIGSWVLISLCRHFGKMCLVFINLVILRKHLYSKPKTWNKMIFFAHTAIPSGFKHR